VGTAKVACVAEILGPRGAVANAGQKTQPRPGPDDEHGHTAGQAPGSAPTHRSRINGTSPIHVYGPVASTQLAFCVNVALTRPSVLHHVDVRLLKDFVRLRSSRRYEVGQPLCAADSHAAAPIVTVGALSTATRELPLYRRFFVVPAREFLSRGAKTGLVTNTISQRDSNASMRIRLARVSLFEKNFNASVQTCSRPVPAGQNASPAGQDCDQCGRAGWPAIV